MQAKLNKLKINVKLTAPDYYSSDSCDAYSFFISHAYAVVKAEPVTDSV